MNRKRIICLIVGILLCIIPVTLTGQYILEFVFYIANMIYSRYSPEAWLITGMLALGLVLIIFALDIKVVENTD